MTSAAWELQKAIKTALEADADLATAMGGSVSFFDYVPEREAMPYLEFDPSTNSEWDVTPYDSSDGYGKEHQIMLHSWSSYEGHKETEAILDAIERALRDEVFMPTLTGHRLVNIRHQFSDRLPDPDRQAYHGVIQFRAVTEES